MSALVETFRGDRSHLSVAVVEDYIRSAGRCVQGVMNLHVIGCCVATHVIGKCVEFHDGLLVDILTAGIPHLVT